MTGTQTAVQNIPRGISFKIVAVLLFLCMSALIKATNDIPIGEIIFFRSAFAIVPIAIMLAWRGQLRSGLQTRHLMSHFIRALIGFTGMICIFLALLNLPLPDATAIFYATPLMIVVLSVILFKERVRAFRWSAVLVGFAGVLIIIWPNLSIASGAFNLEGARSFGILMALAGAVLAAIAQVAIRTLVNTETNAAIVLYFSIIASLLSLSTIPFGWVMPSIPELALLISIGIVGGLGQIFMTDSYRHADMSIIAPFEYSSLIFSILIGYFVFAETPTLSTIIGGLIVTAAGIAIILRERYLGLQRETKKIAAH